MNLEGIAAVDFLRTAVLTIGALGGGYGLVLATRRQKVLEEQTKQGQKQIQQGQDQLFNDRLGRGAEMLGHESMAVRVAGIKVLEDLALTSDHKGIIYQIIDKFLHIGAKRKYDDEAENIQAGNKIEKNERYDVFASAEALIKISSIEEKWAHFQDVDLDNFILPSYHVPYRFFFYSVISRHLNSKIYSCEMTGFFTEADFDYSEFINSDLRGTTFSGAILTSCHFENTNLSRVTFKYSILKQCKFVNVDCTDTFFDTGEKSYSDIGLNIDQFSYVYFEENKPPKGIPNDWIKLENAYRWIESDSHYYRQLIDSSKQNTEIELNLKFVPGKPTEDD